MTILDEILRHRNIERTELAFWVDRQWVRPAKAEDEWEFNDEDLARIELVCDLVQDLKLHNDAVDVILPLMDQIYALRRSLRAMTQAVGELPADTRRQVLESLTGGLKK